MLAPLSIQGTDSLPRDAIALNLGDPEWEKPQIANAYAAAQKLGLPIKLFYSFDMDEFHCDLGKILQYIRQYADHPYQLKVNGKVFVSSFAGSCLGPERWQQLKNEANAFVMPALFGIEGQFTSYRGVLDSWQWYAFLCLWL